MLVVEVKEGEHIQIGNDLGVYINRVKYVPSTGQHRVFLAIEGDKEKYPVTRVPDVAVADEVAVPVQ